MTTGVAINEDRGTDWNIPSIHRPLHHAQHKKPTWCAMALYNRRDDEFSIEEAFVDDFVAPPPPHAQPQKRPTSSDLAARGGADAIKKNQEKNEHVEVALPSTKTDPFAKREGKTLTWTNVNMTLAGKGGKPDLQLLKDVWGEVPMTKTTAIMGPSGAGYVMPVILPNTAMDGLIDRTHV
jgi:hypothetical protein